MVQAIGPHAAPTTAPPRHSPPSDGSSSANIHTIVIYDDNDEMPYSLRIPRVPGKVGSGVTLGALKERLPRHGSFRYYFRTVCPEVGAAFVLEEILNDSQVSGKCIYLVLVIYCFTYIVVILIVL